MDAALLRRVEQQRVEMLYGNALAVSGALIGLLRPFLLQSLRTKGFFVVIDV